MNTAISVVLPEAEGGTTPYTYDVTGLPVDCLLMQTHGLSQERRLKRSSRPSRCIRLRTMRGSLLFSSSPSRSCLW